MLYCVCCKKAYKNEYYADISYCNECLEFGCYKDEKTQQRAKELREKL